MLRRRREEHDDGRSRRKRGVESCDKKLVHSGPGDFSEPQGVDLLFGRHVRMEVVFAELAFDATSPPSGC